MCCCLYVFVLCFVCFCFVCFVVLCQLVLLCVLCLICCIELFFLYIVKCFYLNTYCCSCLFVNRFILYVVLCDYVRCVLLLFYVSSLLLLNTFSVRNCYMYIVVLMLCCDTIYVYSLIVDHCFDYVCCLCGWSCVCCELCLDVCLVVVCVVLLLCCWFVCLLFCFVVFIVLDCCLSSRLLFIDIWLFC